MIFGPDERVFDTLDTGTVWIALYCQMTLTNWCNSAIIVVIALNRTLKCFLYIFIYIFYVFYIYTRETAKERSENARNTGPKETRQVNETLLKVSLPLCN